MNGKHTTLGRVWAGFTMLSMVLSMSFSFAPEAYAQGAPSQVTICHATASDGNPYVQQTVNKNSILNNSGHGVKGVNEGDIIPPFEGLSDGHNWKDNLLNQAIYNNKCYVGGTIAVNKNVVGNDAVKASDFILKVGDKEVTNGEDENFPLGTYTISETPKDDGVPAGFTTTFSDACKDGSITLTTIGQEVDCTITNTYPTDDPTGSIQITKYACTEGTDVMRSVNGVGGTVPETCTEQSGAYFSYVYGEQDDALGPYPELEKTLTPAGTTNSSGLLEITDLETDGRYLIVETDGSNNKLTSDAILGLYCEGDGDTNDANDDNQELAILGDDLVAHCVAYNKKSVDDPDPDYCAVTLVSDTKTTVVEKEDAAAKILSTLHTAWTAAISGASWIWGDDPVAPPVDGVTQNFERKFGWNGLVTSAKLTIAADNTFVAELNGDAVGSDLTEFNYVAPAKEYDVTGLIDQGNNELSVKVYNMIHSTDPAVNPAGLLYKLEVKGTDKNCDIPYVEEVKQCLVVSDTATKVGDDDASLTYVHPAWTTQLATGTAKWIWDSTVDPLNGETLTFTRTFNVDNAPTLATLRVAADNGYTATLNGNPLSCDGSGITNFTAVDTCTAPVVVGVNTLTFVATNAPYATNDPKTNPSGLIYELTIDGSSCSPVPVEVPTYPIDGYKWNDEDGDGYWDKDEEGIEGWAIKATLGQTVLATTTDKDGYYYFNVPAGEWTISETQQGGWVQTAPKGDVCVLTRGEVLQENLARLTYVVDDYVVPGDCNFGNWQMPEYACPAELNMIKNGSFEAPEVTSGDLWQKFAVVADWLVTKVTGGDPTTLEFHELWSGNVAANGDQYVELDGDHSTRVAQTVTTEDGAQYKLYWAFAPRHQITAEQNQLSVLVNDVEVATEGPVTGVAPLALTDWNLSNYTFTATGATTKVMFEDAGPSNTYGTFLDDVRLCKIKDAPEDDGEGDGDPEEPGITTVSGGGGSCANCDEDKKKARDEEDKLPTGETRGASDSKDTVQVTAVPTVAGVNAGAGGASQTPAQTLPLIALLAMIASLAVIRKTANE